MNEEMLSVEDKSHIIRQFIRNLAYSRYNIEVSLIAEVAVSNPNQNNIDSFTIQLEEIDEKISALESELTTIEGA
jgi:hypothetical protein